MTNSHKTFWRWLATGSLALGGMAHGQWITQTTDLKGGWNAVYLHVDASHAAVHEVMAGTSDIEEIWLWNPPVVGQQFIDSPMLPTTTGSRWTKWTSNLGPTSALKVLVPNAAYYVKVADGVASMQWSLKGRPAAPTYDWSVTGLNFVGFPLAQPLSYERFLLPAPHLLQGAEVFASMGGPFGESNPVRVFDYARTTIRRGEAVWMRVDAGFKRYFGPFEVTGVPSAGIDFGTDGTQASFRIRNTKPTTNVVSLTMIPSELPPTGQPVIPGMPPVVVRGDLDSASLKHVALSLTAANPEDEPVRPVQFVLPPAGQPGSDIQVVLGVVRTRMTAAAGTRLAGVLRLVDADGDLRVDFPVAATVQDTTGLWVGDAKVSQVTQYLKQYARNGDGSPVLGRRWTTTSADTFTGGDAGEGLDLEGTFAYAINVGGTTDANVGSVNFVRSTGVEGYAQTVGSSTGNWLAPAYGTTANDDGMETVMSSVASSASPARAIFQMTVERGVRYKLQLLFGEAGDTAPGRGFDIIVGGKVILPAFIPGAYTLTQGTFAEQKNKVGVVVTHEFSAADMILRVELDGAGPEAGAVVGRDPILNGLTLERLDPSALPPELVADDGSYAVRPMEERLTGVTRSFPLRLILHDDGTNTMLLQRVFVGTGTATNTVVATGQHLLDAASLSTARRISSAHLPWTTGNMPWAFSSEGSAMSVVVNIPYDAVASNPFVHQYHPDHDNLNASFEAVLPKGQESFGITRTIRLQPGAIGDDFEGLTAGFRARVGTYEETMTIEGSGPHVRTFRSAGIYSLNRISTISTLTR